MGLADEFFLPLLLMFSSFIIILSMGQEPFLPNAMVLPVTKDASTLQYVAEFQMGEPLSPVKLGIDLSGKFLWLDCASVIPSSSLSQYAIGSCSTQCSMAISDRSCRRSSGPDHHNANRLCDVQVENPITGMVSSGDLREGIIAAEVNDGLKTGSLATIPQFLFSCAEKSLLKGLPREVKGILGTGNTRIAFPSQVSATFGFRRKFALCLSSSNGVILSGESPHLDGEDISRSLLYTPLTYHQGETSHGYYINVKSIKINGRKLSTSKSLLSVDEEGNGGTTISTAVPYTTMESTLYSTFTDAYIRAATAMNLTRVPPVAPFEVCFSSKGVEETREVGPIVPTIDLVLQSEMVKWKIEGRNSMVHVNEEVMCLGFLDGGGLSSTKASMVIGGHQLEERFLEFNLENSMLGFSTSSSLLVEQRSCSDFRSNSIAIL